MTLAEITTDPELLRRYVSERFDIEMSEQDAEWISHHKHRPSYHCDDCQIIWLNNRLRELQYIPTTFSGTLFDERFEVVMHVFFLSLEETPEMLARLPEVTATDKKLQTARSKISTTPLAIQPIDGLAGVVSGVKGLDEQP